MSTLIKNQNDLLNNSEKALLNLFNDNESLEVKNDTKDELIKTFEKEVFIEDAVTKDVAVFEETNAEEEFLEAFQKVDTLTDLEYSEHLEEMADQDAIIMLYEKIKHIENIAGQEYAVKYLKAYLEYSKAAFNDVFESKNRHIKIA